MIGLSDVHYFPLPSQGNVYSLATVEGVGGARRLLVASLRRKVFSLELQSLPGEQCQASVKEVPFTYIPNGAEIIALDAFHTQADDLVVGITIVKPAMAGRPTPSQTFLNVYSEWGEAGDSLLDSVAQNCFSLELSFAPYHLFHTPLPASREIVWLLSGGDEQIHLFREDKLNHCYQEEPLQPLFPELYELSCGVVLWIDVVYSLEQDRRITALACESGCLLLTQVDVASNTVLSTHTKNYSGPLSSVRLFTLDNESLDLVVTSTLSPSVVYSNVLKQGLSEFHGLPESGSHDIALCVLLADVDMDGRLEIMIGTYGQELLIYKQCERVKEWHLLKRMTLANPIYSLLYLDLTADGVNELVALTLKGVHVMQHNVDQTVQLLKQRLDCE
ncbi:KICSTOR complex protein kaptin isoform X2 [Cloeon dipterum]|uniref:KICSTOR complex protein kaptin isoform X2 n=1 Tax=Cloeon dipterum TaxID=197152 RepID=UPI0032200EE0